MVQQVHRSIRRGPSRGWVVVAVVGVLHACLIGPATAAPHAEPAPPPVSYQPPSTAPVVDPFRPPSTPYGPGNRGWEYDTPPGEVVRAAGDGVVTFAGSVGGTLHVTIEHADGLRTSYSFLASLTVRRNDPVRRGDGLGTTGGSFHFGVRDPDGTYLDPALLFAERLRREVHLVGGSDDGDGAPASPVAEVDAFESVVRLRGVAAVAYGRRVAAQVNDTWGLRLRAAADSTSSAHLASIARAMQAWYLQRGRCTPPSAAPPKAEGRRIVVLVGGIGSSSEQAAIDQLDTAALGYADGDVVRFSYRGGRTPAPSPEGSTLAELPSSAYGPADTAQDLEASAAALRALLEQIASTQPGVPIDVVAHSQGGVVGRLALLGDQPPREVQNLVTLGAPHGGANLATAIAAVRLDPTTRAALAGAAALVDVGIDPDAPSVAQLAETSSAIDGMNRRPWPTSVRLTSIGAAGDLTVPAPRTLVGDGSTSTVVRLGGVHAHDQLPSAPAARREVALALAGAPPTCRPFDRALADAVGAESIDAVEDALTAAAAWGPVAVGSRPGR